MAGGSSATPRANSSASFCSTSIFATHSLTNDPFTSRTHSLTFGRASRVNRSAARSRAFPVPLAIRPVKRAKSLTSLRVSRKSSNRPASSKNPSTASCRASISSRIRSGRISQPRNSLPPMAVTVWSMDRIRLVSAPGMAGCRISRFRCVAESRRRQSSERNGLGACRCWAAFFKVSVR